MSWTRLLIALVLVAGFGCQGGGTDANRAGESPAAEGSLPPPPSPEELAAQFAVPVPKGGEVAEASVDDLNNTAEVEVTYEGEPDVDGYTEAMEEQGWSIDEVNEVGSSEIKATHEQLALIASVLYRDDNRVEWAIGPIA